MNGNHAQLLQVLLNLLLNAFDAVAGNVPARRSVVLGARAEGGAVVVTVTDNGTGMDAAAQEPAGVWSVRGYKTSTTNGPRSSAGQTLSGSASGLIRVGNNDRTPQGRVVVAPGTAGRR